MSPDKAPGEDGIPNRALKAMSSILAPLLLKVFSWSMRKRYCPKHFKKAITVVLRKPGKDDYSQPKSYRPVALMNTLGKLLDTILAKRLAFDAELYKMLPITHVGGRKLTSAEHGIHLITERIYSSWREQKVSSMLSLDVSGAFDNVDHERLLHNMRKRGVHTRILDWLRSYLKRRVTTIRIGKTESIEYEVETGIPQVVYHFRYVSIPYVKT